MYARSLVSSAIFILTTTLEPQLSSAQTAPRCDSQDRCAVHLSSALRHDANGDFAKALGEFKTAYAQSSDPRLLLDVGRTLHKLERYVEALEIYEVLKRLNVADSPLQESLHRFTAEARAHVPPSAPPARAEVRPQSSSPNATVGPIDNRPVAIATTQLQLNLNSPPTAPPTANAALPVTLRAEASVPLIRRPWFWGIVGSGVAVSISAIVGGVLMRPFDKEGAQPFPFSPSQGALSLQHGGIQ